MLIVIAVFGGVLALVLGAYYLLVMKHEQKLLDRLQPKAEKKSSLMRTNIVKAEGRHSSVTAVHNVLSRTTRVTGKSQRFLDQAGLKWTVATFLLMTGCFALFPFVLLFFLTGNLILAAIFVPIGALLPFMYVRRRRTKRMYKFEEQFPEAIDLVSRALRAGHSLPTGLGMVADELGPPVGLEFRTLYDEQNFGLTFPEALRNFAARIPVLDARFFVTAVLTQRETGGNLAEVLDNLSAVIRERFKIKRQVRVLSAHGRITGWVLACLPPSVAVFAFLLSPSHIQTLTGDPLGIKMLIAAAVMQVLGTLVIRKIVQIEY